MKKEHTKKITMTNMLDRLVLDTYGKFINYYPEQQLVQKITKELVPVQLGNKEPFCIPIAGMEESQTFRNEQKYRARTYCRIDSPEDTHGALKGQKKELMNYAEQMGLRL